MSEAEVLNVKPLLQFVADRGDAGRRLDLALVRHIRDVSRMTRTRAQAWIDAGAVTVDGIVVQRAAARLREGAAIAVQLPDSTPLRTRPEADAAALDVVYEDSSLLVVNKPAGIVVHPSYKNASGTLLNAILGHLKRSTDASVVADVPGIITRLDKDTSGLVLVALNAAVHRHIQREAAAGRVRKEYLAIVEGCPAPHRGTISLPLARDAADRRRVTVQAGGAASETRYEVLEEMDGYALVRCQLVTGRTHQIRVHMAESGWPIVGDRVYGHPHPALGRQALHAWRVSLSHPVTAVPMLVEAPVPADLRALMKTPGSTVSDR